MCNIDGCCITLVMQANFSRAVAAVSNAQAKKVNRFLPNPERHWGPKIRAGRTITSKHASLLGHEAVNGAICQKDGNGLALDKAAPGTEEGVSTTEEKCSDDNVPRNHD
jgi:tRNA (guanine26-N2/guanine27-N2)-dimethyltransferase